MPESLVELAAQKEKSGDRSIYGATIAQVVNNEDLTGLSRVQVRLPWLPGFEPWARVAVLQAGSNQGTYFIPQVGDEVLVAFNHGDVREPFVIGCLWNDTDQPPTTSAGDAVTRRVIKTPSGHEIAFDETAQSITIQTAAQQTITLDSKQITMSTSGEAATVKLDTQGNISVQAGSSIKLKAPKITIEGEVTQLKGSASASIDGGQACEIKASVVKIN